MCAGRRLIYTGDTVRRQCPSTETKPVQYQKHLRMIGNYHPDMTIAELARRIQKDVWWVFERITVDFPDVPHQLVGARYQTKDGHVHRVKSADRFAVHWEGEPAFSLWEDVADMERVS
jgi:hypothetical protein